DQDPRQDIRAQPQAPRGGAGGRGEEAGRAHGEPRQKAPRAAPAEARADRGAEDERSGARAADQRARGEGPPLRGRARAEGALEGAREEQEEGSGGAGRPRHEVAMTMQEPVTQERSRKSLPIIDDRRPSDDLDVDVEAELRAFEESERERLGIKAERRQWAD